MSDILICNTAFAAEINGELVTVRKGATVRAGHPLIASREEFFDAPSIDFDYDPDADDESTSNDTDDDAENPTSAEPQPKAEKPTSDESAEPEAKVEKPKTTRPRRRIG